jgi:hypothetical protein
MHEALTLMLEAYERNCIISNLSNNLSQKVGALKRDGVRTRHMVCSMVVLENIQSGRMVVKVLGVDR